VCFHGVFAACGYTSTGCRRRQRLWQHQHPHPGEERSTRQGSWMWLLAALGVIRRRTLDSSASHPPCCCCRHSQRLCLVQALQHRARYEEATDQATHIRSFVLRFRGWCDFFFFQQQVSASQQQQQDMRSRLDEAPV
jgi:hypothetical protein